MKKYKVFIEKIKMIYHIIIGGRNYALFIVHKSDAKSNKAFGCCFIKNEHDDIFVETIKCYLNNKEYYDKIGIQKRNNGRS
jgi:hypothetical protein